MSRCLLAAVAASSLQICRPTQTIKRIGKEQVKRKNTVLTLLGLREERIIYLACNVGPCLPVCACALHPEHYLSITPLAQICLDVFLHNSSAHQCGLGLRLGGAAGQKAVSPFAWAQMSGNSTVSLAARASNCSYFISQNDAITSNHANSAGAVMFSTNMSSTDIRCNGNSALQQSGQGCTAWGSSNNSVGDPTSDVVGYGPGLAFPPASVRLGGKASASLQYVSDGASKLAVPFISVLDQAGTIVTAGITALDCL